MARIAKRIVPALLLVFGSAPTSAFGTSPSQRIQETIHQVATVINASPTDDEAARRRSLRETIMPLFDWTAMAKQTLGKHWDGISARQHEFTDAFAEFLGNVYAGNIGSYKDQKILFIEETVTNNLAQVKTRIVPNHGEPTSVDYQLHQVQGEWKIYDVVIEDISLVSNYRSQFGRILAKGSVDDLFRSMAEKRLSQRN